MSRPRPPPRCVSPCHCVRGKSLTGRSRLVVLGGTWAEMVLRTCFRSKPPRTSARGRASVSLLLGYQTQSHLSVGVSTRFDWKTAWSLAVVAAVTAVTPAAGQGTGFTGSVIVVTQPGNDTFATCPVGYVVSEACSSGFQPQVDVSLHVPPAPSLPSLLPTSPFGCTPLSSFAC